MDKWKLIRAADFIDFNPRESVSKGAMAKKVAMEQLQPFTRDIPAFEVAPFNGGSKFRNGDTLMARITPCPVSYTHLRAHETPEHLVCRLLLEKKKKKKTK